MDNDKFFKVVVTHAEMLVPDIMGAINTGDLWHDTAICRAQYHHSIRKAREAVEGILTDHWFKDADVSECTGHIWHCSKLRTEEVHAPGGKAYKATNMLYKQIRIEAYTIQA